MQETRNQHLCQKLGFFRQKNKNWGTKKISLGSKEPLFTTEIIEIHFGNGQNFHFGIESTCFWKKSNFSIFRNVEISYLPGRGPGVEGEEGIYGSGGVNTSGTRGLCACRTHHDRSNDMWFEEFRLNLRELEVMKFFDRWGIFPV